MTDDTMHLRAFVAKTPDPGNLLDMIALAAKRLMEVEVGAKNGEAHSLRSTRPSGAAQRPSRPRLGNPCSDGREPDPEAAHGLLLLRLSRAAPDGGEGAERGDPEAYVKGS
jgi:hypothetical protein